jgi:hypothetical protein
MTMAFNPVEHCLDLIVIVLLGKLVVGGPVRLVWIGRGLRVRAAVNLRSEEIVDACPDGPDKIR